MRNVAVTVPLRFDCPPEKYQYNKLAWWGELQTYPWVSFVVAEKHQTEDGGRKHQVGRRHQSGEEENIGERQGHLTKKWLPGSTSEPLNRSGHRTQDSRHRSPIHHPGLKKICIGRWRYFTVEIDTLEIGYSTRLRQRTDGGDCEGPRQHPCGTGAGERNDHNRPLGGGTPLRNKSR